MEFVVKKSRKHERKTVQGRVEVPDGSLAGFLVHFWSCQGETERRADVLTSHAGQQGNFFVDVLPGANYRNYTDGEHKRGHVHLVSLFPQDESGGFRRNPRQCR
jgi:hypothetical protein